MTDDDARRLATRIIDTWPNGPRAYIWRDTLTLLRFDLATSAYDVLTREHIHGAPTTGQFHAAYRALERAINPPDTTPTVDDTRDAISLEQYLDQLRTRASHGDSEATAELHQWQQTRHSIRPDPGVIG